MSNLPQSAPAKMESESVEEDKIRRINLDDIVPSPFEPQKRRRAKLKPEKINELGNTIVKQGLLQPILVRPLHNLADSENPDRQFYEIVFGESRWLASRAKNLETIKCFVREMSDAEVIEAQYVENHHRQDNDPLDDAFYFKYLFEKKNYSVSRIAAEIGEEEQDVVDKLMLNELVPDAREELSKELLKLKHAYLLARYPIHVQQEVCDKKLAYLYYDHQYRNVSLKQFQEEINSEVLLRLADAPFDTLDPRLHIKNLICPDCPERTGFSPMLFPDLTGDDQCLNRRCFKIKTETHLTLQRETIARKLPNPERKPIEEQVKAVPLVTERRYTDEKPFAGAKIIVNQDLLEKPECSFSELSLAVDGGRKGQQVYVCRNGECPVHRPKAGTPELERKEEEFNRRVAAENRVKVLRAAIEFFDDYKPIWMFDDLIRKLLIQLWYACDWETLKPLRRAIKDWENVPKNNDWTAVEAFAGSLDKRRQSQLLFLFIHLDRAADEMETLRLLSQYTRLNYLTLDAETRFELAPAEFKAEANLYLQQIKNGKQVEPPRFWANFDDVEMANEEEN